MAKPRQALRPSTDRYERVTAVATARGAKNIPFDGLRSRFYTTVPPAAGRPGAIWVYQLQRQPARVTTSKDRGCL